MKNIFSKLCSTATPTGVKSRTAFCLIVVAAFVACFTSCKKHEEDVTTHAYRISYQESKHYTVSAPAEAHAGERITVNVATTQSGLTVEGVTYNGKECEAEGTSYVFTMPAENVTLEIHLMGSIVVESSEFYTARADKTQAAEGETVTVTFNTNDTAYTITQATYNDKACTLVSNEGTKYVYSFVMPDCPVSVKALVAQNFLSIVYSDDANVKMFMLDCIDNVDEPRDEWVFSQIPGGLVHFKYEETIGYNVTTTLTGDTTGTDYSQIIYWSLASDNMLGQDCWAFEMPLEPVTITLRSEEASVYPGEAFLGEYKGYSIGIGTGNILSKDDASTLTFDIKASAAFIGEINGDNHFEGLYSLDGKSFSYIREKCRDRYAASGHIVSDDRIYVTLSDLQYDRPENARSFFVSKNDVEYVCIAENEYGLRYLLEVTENGTKSWYFISRTMPSFITEQAPIVPAEVVFTRGTSLTDSPAEAKISLEGNLYIKYTNDAGSTPLFTYRGKEVGQYTSEGYDTLTLDGFGTATYGSIEGTYTLAGALLTLQTDNGDMQFNIDIEKGTYTRVQVNDPWDGAAVYSTQTAKTYWSGTTATTGIATVQIDRDLSGDAKPGYVAIKLRAKDGWGTYSDIISDCQPYFYDAAAGEITVTNVMQGNSTGSSSTRKNIVLKVAGDRQSMQLSGNVYASSSYNGDRYMFGGESSILYSEGGTGTNWSSPMIYSAPVRTNNMTDATLTVKVNMDLEGGTKPGYASFETEGIADCKPYDFDASTSTLTIRGVYHGVFINSSITNGEDDIPFTVADDQSTLTLSKSYSYGMIFPANFSSVGFYIPIHEDIVLTKE